MWHSTTMHSMFNIECVVEFFQWKQCWCLYVENVEGLPFHEIKYLNSTTAQLNQFGVLDYEKLPNTVYDAVVTLKNDVFLQQLPKSRKVSKQSRLKKVHSRTIVIIAGTIIAHCNEIICLIHVFFRFVGMQADTIASRRVYSGALCHYHPMRSLTKRLDANSAETLSTVFPTDRWNKKNKESISVVSTAVWSFHESCNSGQSLLFDRQLLSTYALFCWWGSSLDFGWKLILWAVSW